MGADPGWPLRGAIDGPLVCRGAINDNARNREEVRVACLDSASTAMSAGKEIANASTKALGCRIKFVDRFVNT